jgi:hypothetical protein
MNRLALVLISILAAAAALVAGCGSKGPTPSERLQLYQSHAGPPVTRFRLTRTFTWTPLGDQAVAVWPRINEGFLLEFRSRCSGLAHSRNISLSNSGDWVTARFDSVQLRGSMSTVGTQQCRIWTIRPLDGRTLNDARRELREAQAVPRAAGVTEEQ